MYCSNCGQKLPDTARFCTSCGKPVHNSSGEKPSVDRKIKEIWHQANQLAEILVPESLAKRFPSVTPMALVGICAAMAVIVFAGVFAVWGRAGHDLSGTYSTGEYFPINRITFQTNGHFSAEYYGYGIEEIYQGTYRKTGDGEYSLVFTDGETNSSSAVLQYDASSMGSQMELSVKRLSETSLAVSVIPKISYWAWNGVTVTFYQY